MIANNKFEVNSRHPDILVHSSVNLDVAVSIGFETEFIAHEGFFLEIAAKGVRAGVENLNQGFTPGSG